MNTDYTQKCVMLHACLSYVVRTSGTAAAQAATGKLCAFLYNILCMLTISFSPRDNEREKNLYSCIYCSQAQT